MIVAVQIRWMLKRDMPHVQQIEKNSFEFPWTEENFLKTLRKRNMIGMVAEANNEILGYMIYELHKNELYLLNLAVKPIVKRSTVATQMIQKLISKLADRRRSRIVLEIRETNYIAQVFFKKCGFKATSVIKDFYENVVEDAYVMQFKIEEEKKPIEIPNRMGHVMTNYDETDIVDFGDFKG